MNDTDASHVTAHGITVNGSWRAFNGMDMNTPLLWFLREQCGLIGTKYGCGIAYCGACTVLLEKTDPQGSRLQAIRACVTPLSALSAHGAPDGKPLKPAARVITIEGLAAHHRQDLAAAGTPQCPPASQPSGSPTDSDCLHPVQAAWIDLQVPQCGYCQSGQILSAVALLEALAASGSPLGKDLINQAMSGNLCRCGTYPRIRKAIRAAATAMHIEVSA